MSYHKPITPYMSATLLKIHPENPPLAKILQAADVLRRGGIIIYPTDTIYGLGCDLHNVKAVERVCQLKGTEGGATGA